MENEEEENSRWPEAQNVSESHDPRVQKFSIYICSSIYANLRVWGQNLCKSCKINFDFDLERKTSSLGNVCYRVQRFHKSWMAVSNTLTYVINKLTVSDVNDDLCTICQRYDI